MKVKVKSLSCVRLFATLWTVAHQAPPSMGFSRQEYCSGCHVLLKGIFPTQGLNLGLPHFRQTLYHLSHLMQMKYHTKLETLTNLENQFKIIQKMLRMKDKLSVF